MLMLHILKSLDKFMCVEERIWIRKNRFKFNFLSERIYDHSQISRTFHAHYVFSYANQWNFTKSTCKIKWKVYKSVKWAPKCLFKLDEPQFSNCINMFCAFSCQNWGKKNFFFVFWTNYLHVLETLVEMHSDKEWNIRMKWIKNNEWRKIKKEAAKTWIESEQKI